MAVRIGDTLPEGAQLVDGTAAATPGPSRAESHRLRPVGGATP